MRKSSASSHRPTARSTLCVATLLVVAALLLVVPRSTGLFRGLVHPGSFHPDTTKQVQAVQNFLKGQSVWTTGSLAYDGYPYGLNHVDEGVIRVLRPAGCALVQFVNPKAEIASLPGLGELFIWCRVLRVIYGTLAVLLLIDALRRMQVRRSCCILAFLLLATAPLLSTVTHFASGDVGTDLFAALAIWFCSFLTHQRTRTAFLGMGFAVGSAFACKYNGMLLNALPLILLILNPRPLTQMLKRFGCLVLGNLIGFVWLTPQIFVLPERTLKLIGKNFVYIKTYGAPAGFYDLPKLEQLGTSLGNNLPVIFQSFGFLLTIIVIIGLIAAAIPILKNLRSIAPSLQVIFALLATGLGGSIISISGKPAVQPFHFSYLIFPCVAGLCLGLGHLRPGTVSKLAFALLAAIVPLQSVTLQRESFFWAREDTRDVALKLHSDILKPTDRGHHQKLIAARLKPEAPNLSVFRNLPRDVSFPDAEVWESDREGALPQVHWPVSKDWIFTNTARFPRESRSIWLKSGTIEQRHLGDKPESLWLHIHSGVHAFKGEVNGNQLFLAGFTEKVLELPVHGHPMRIRAISEFGDAWIRFSTTRPEPAKHIPAAKLKRARFLEGAIPVGGLHRQSELYRGPMSRGIYTLRINGEPSDLPVLEIQSLQSEHPSLWRTIQLNAEGPVSQTTFVQDSPACFVRLVLKHGPAAATWEIQPTDWLATQPIGEAPPPPATLRIPVKSGGAVHVGEFPSPLPIETSHPLSLQLEMAPGLSPLAEKFLFLHVLDAQGKQVWARDFCLRDISQGIGSLPETIRFDLPPGSYELTGGVHHPRLYRRLALDGQSKDKRVHLQSLQLISP